VADATGAPPEDLDGTSDEASITFDAHPEHADGDDHATWDCAECHGAASRSYGDALLDPDHWWDATPGAAEVAMSGLSPQGQYDPATSQCSTVYCHGNGQGTGARADGPNAIPCDGCHPDQGSSPDAWDRMSGEHKKHLDDANASCSDCHYAVVRNGQAIHDPSLHVDGDADVRMDPGTGITWSGSSCGGGSCHGSGHSHSGDGW
jgi:hypothetical protein